MPIISASIVPNLSLLIPSVGRESTLLFSKTLDAYNDLALKLQNQKIESLVIISPRGIQDSLGNTINIGPQFDIDFEEFGDLTTKITLTSSLSILSKIETPLRQLDPLSLLSLPKLDYGTAVPAILLEANKHHYQILPFYPAKKSLQAQYYFGSKLASLVHSNYQRIALIASCNFSYRLSKSPAGYLPKAKGYDKKIINSFETDDFRFLLSFEESQIKDYYEYGLAPLAMMAGAMSNFSKNTKIASYEHSLGLATSIINFDF